jgi:hypothetical protein
MPQFSTDLHASFTIKTTIYGTALPTVNRCPMLGDLLVTLTRKRRSQLMKSFEIVGMQNVSSGPDDSLNKLLVAFTGRNHVAAAHRRYLHRKRQGGSNMLIHRNPTRCRGTSPATLGAILYVDLPKAIRLTT